MAGTFELYSSVCIKATGVTGVIVAEDTSQTDACNCNDDIFLFHVHFSL